MGLMFGVMATRAVRHEATHRRLWLRALWFLLVGWWLTLFTLTIAYLCLLTIIGLPAAFWLFDRVPLVLTLQPRSEWAADEVTGTITQGPEQLSLVVRALYFVFVGWWLSGIWIVAAYAFCVTIIGIPVTIVMLNMLPTVVTLQRN
jgi:uncharacterized membrane protein YccF (DUF307 family)